MKRNIGKILAMAIVAIMMMSTIAFADAAMGEPAVADNTVTVTLSGLTANEEATILVVTDEVALASVTESDIVYIDQLTVAEDGTVTFTLDASAAVPAEPTADVYVDIYCGYTNMADAAPLSGTAKIYTYVAPEDPEVPEVTYGEADGVKGITLNDALVTLDIAADNIVPTEEQKVAVDVDAVSGVTLNDALCILERAADETYVFPIEQK
ncbi:MAG: hypothetical protein IJB70_11350 [Clostridia bacterium]|nr:hypothetical protein [Clostridia bacterium]